MGAASRRGSGVSQMPAHTQCRRRLLLVRAAEEPVFYTRDRRICDAVRDALISAAGAGANITGDPRATGVFVCHLRAVA